MTEYWKLVKRTDFRMFSGIHEYLHDLTDFERETYFEVSTKCAQTPASVISTIRFVEHIVANDIPGDFAECGVWLGASPYVIAKTLRRLGQTDRRIFMYDTYAGMPSGAEIDVPYSPGGNYESLKKTAERTYAGSEHMKGPLEIVKANVERSGYPRDKLVYVKGLVEDTIPATCPERIALLRLDTDHYGSTKHELVHLYPPLSTGGLLIIDDYGFFLGSKQATDEYFREHKIPACLFRIDEHVRACVKHQA